jgi:hypothetical protein
VVGTLLARLGLRLHRAATIDTLVRRARVATEVVAVLTRPGPERAPGAEGVIFSMDRALQLEGLLASYAANVANPAPVHVLYRASSAAHRAAYDEVLSRFAGVVASVSVQAGRETFRDQLLAILGSVSASRLFFLVDDDLFVERFDLNRLLDVDTRIAIPSFRLGTNLTRSYVVQQPQPLPRLYRWDGTGAGAHDPGVSDRDASRDDLLCWRWSDGAYEWAYPLSVDGHIFGTAEIEAIARHCDFDSPNTFENSLQEFADLFRPRLGVCYRKSRMLNLPVNKVQADVANLHGDVHQDDLLREWQRGFRLDHEALFQVENESAHQELNISFRSREPAA